MKEYVTFLLLIVLSNSAYSQNNAINTNEVNKLNKEQVQQKTIPSKTKSGNFLTIIKQIPSPITYPCSLAYDGEDLWISGFNESQLHKISMLDGTIISSIPISIQQPLGITFDGEYFLVAGTDTDVIQQIDFSGNIISTIEAPVSQPSYCQGLTFDGTNIWFNDQRAPFIGAPNDVTYIIDHNGTIINQYSSIGNFPTGLAFDGEYIWSIDNDLDELHKIDPLTYSVLETYDTPSDLPLGLTFDGQYLWLVDNNTKLLYQLDIGILSTPEYQLSNLLSMYPNPTSQLINIDFKEPFENLDISLYNMTGKLLQNQQFRNKNHIKLNIDNLQKGIYYINIKADGELFTRKIIKE